MTKINDSHITKCAKELGFSHIQINENDVVKAKPDEVVQVYNELLHEYNNQAQSNARKTKELADMRAEKMKAYAEVESLRQSYEKELTWKRAQIENLSKELQCQSERASKAEYRTRALEICLKSLKTYIFDAINGIRLLSKLSMSQEAFCGALSLISAGLWEAHEDIEETEEIPF